MPRRPNSGGTLSKTLHADYSRLVAAMPAWATTNWIARRYHVTPGAVRKWQRNLTTIPYNVVVDMLGVIAEHQRTNHRAGNYVAPPVLCVEDFVRPTVYYREKRNRPARKEKNHNG